MIIIAGRIVEIPPRYAEISPADAPKLLRVLRHIWLREITKQLERFATTRPEETYIEETYIFAEASRLQTIDIFAEIATDPNLEAMIEAEAKAIAMERVEPAELAELAVRAEARHRVEVKLLASAALVSSHKEEYARFRDD